jgi:hypothetical protein
MQTTSKKPIPKGIVVRTLLIFILSYGIVLILWIQVADYYGYAITRIASGLVAVIKDVRFETIEKKAPIMLARFSPARDKTDFFIDIPVNTSSYAFNIPLTLGIVAALFPFIRRRGRASAEALAILLGVHLLYIGSLEASSLTAALSGRGLDVATQPRLFAYQFFWGFMHFMVMRFAPFLIGFYLFLARCRHSI